MKNTPFKLKSGNTTSFKNMGSSPVKQIRSGGGKPGGGAGEALDHWEKYRKAKALKQDAAVDKLLTKKNISKIDFERQLSKITKTVDPNPKKSTTLGRLTKAFSNTVKQGGGKHLQNLISGGKQLARVGGGLASATALAIPLALESFTKRSIERTKEGKSGFNITKGQKKPTSKNVHFFKTNVSSI